MVTHLYTPRDHHLVRTKDQYASLHAAKIAKRAKRGRRVEVHDSPAPLVAYVSANSWVVQCECGAGNATDPAWGVAYCFACGAVHRSIVFPDDVAGVEAALLDRGEVMTRHWQPGETADDLRRETAQHARGGRR